MLNQRDTVTTNRERPFGIEELFFSTTDPKGIITTCNDVFIRVAEFEPAELLGKPHNVVRHPDMPRCVFALLWEFLLSDRPIGAYVKNRSKSGEYYWVYALASPTSQGFLSVRLKPTSDYFTVIKTLYPQLLALEQSFANWKDGMAASRKTLDASLNELGFTSYTEFMQTTLRAELLQRDAALNATAQESEKPARQGSDSSLDTLLQIFRGLDSLLSLRTALCNKERFFHNLGNQVSRVALNASIRAAHLAEEGRALGAIGEAVSGISNEIKRDSAALNSRSTELAQGLGVVSFHVAQAILQSQAKEFFDRELEAHHASDEEQVRRFGKTVAAIGSELDEARQESLHLAINGLAGLRELLVLFDQVATSLEKILLSIHFSYVTGKTLSAHIRGAEGFAALLSDMVSLSNSAREEISSLKTAVIGVRSDLERWRTLPSLASPVV